MTTTAQEMKATARPQVGKGAARATRRTGQVPGVIYGDKKPPLAISLDAAGALIVLVHRAESGDVWRTITPGQGVVPATVDGQLPDAWPAG